MAKAPIQPGWLRAKDVGPYLGLAKATGYKLLPQLEARCGLRPSPISTGLYSVKEIDKAIRFARDHDIHIACTRPANRDAVGEEASED